jgi:oxygen-independent coproporphyrinogen-3 oxidase
MHRDLIQKIMCQFAISKREFFLSYGVSFDVYFAGLKEKLEELILEGFVEESSEELRATDLGKLFLRVVASVFDQYLKTGGYSKVI